MPVDSWTGYRQHIGLRHERCLHVLVEMRARRLMVQTLAEIPGALSLIEMSEVLSLVRELLVVVAWMRLMAKVVSLALPLEQKLLRRWFFLFSVVSLLRDLPRSFFSGVWY